MKPVAILRHSATEGPGYFGIWLERHGIPWRLVKIDEGEAVPRDAQAFAGLGLMGGPMSVNDDLPWIAPVLRLIRNAVRDDVPVIGHCLGGQLMARALGGTVSRNAVKEIGWGALEVLPGSAAERWLGKRGAFEAFHWHGETFTLPPGADPIARSAHCENQMFALGKHLAMQCHIEMTPELIAEWCADWHNEVQSLAQHAPSVQTPAQMLANVSEKTAMLNGVAARVYDEWSKGLMC